MEEVAESSGLEGVVLVGKRAEFRFNRQELEDYANLKRKLNSILEHPGSKRWKRLKRDPREEVKFRLPKFHIPKEIYQAMQRNDVSLLKLSTSLNKWNFANQFQTLLWIEEADQTIALSHYDLKAVTLGRSGNLFIVYVPSLAEGKLSLVSGDKLLLIRHPKQELLSGRIHQVYRESIAIKVFTNEEIRSRIYPYDLEAPMICDVSFVLPRTAYRRNHYGVISYNNHRSRLFPDPEPQLSEPFIDISEEDSDELLNFGRSLNKSQRSAVIYALRSECRPAPYILFGPPGTGKTFTLVEAILQTYQRKRGAKILVCGSSNACADSLAQRIKKSGIVPKGEMLRLSAFNKRQGNFTSDDIKDINITMAEITPQTFSIARIVITTCTQSGCLEEFEHKFEYLFIDEAGQATEPEVATAMSLLSSRGCCVLAGDPHQLGPVCMSQVASENGLGTSTLERLSKRDVYALRETDGGKMAYDPRYITQLVESYRCDPRILSIGNEVFYNNALECVNETPRKWLDLFGVEYPLVFHPVRGRDKRDQSDPSRYNPEEAEICAQYAKRLYDNGLKPEQLGIMSPYRGQIKQILRRTRKLAQCKVATMESFQGDEREIIIISMVRGAQRNMDIGKFAFLFNPRRFNVAISRAKWMVIAIGHPDVLALDKYWSLYMERASKISCGEPLSSSDDGYYSAYDHPLGVTRSESRTRI